MDYYTAIEVIESSEQMKMIQAGAYSNYKKQDQTKIIKSINKVINDGFKSPKARVGLDGFADILSRGING